MGDDQLLAESANPRAITTPDPALGWALYILGKHARKEWWHSITEIACGAVFLDCGGRMSVSDGPELAAHPPLSRRCIRCQALRAQRRLVEAGLVEMCEVAL